MNFLISFSGVNTEDILLLNQKQNLSRELSALFVEVLTVSSDR